MSNNLKELNDILFSQLRRLDSAAAGGNLDAEVQRTESMVKVAKPILEGSRQVLEATKLKAEYIGLKGEKGDMPPMLEAKAND